MITDANAMITEGGRGGSAAYSPGMVEKWFPAMPEFSSPEEERLHRKQRLAAGFRLFAKFGFEEGVAGHITARDPIEPDTFWVNPFGVPFAHEIGRASCRGGGEEPGEGV